MGGGGISTSSTYDVIVRTQGDFEKLIASPTWLDATSVCFIGDGGNLKFARSDGLGILIPSTVKQIQGISNTTIEVNNFKKETDVNEAAFWYKAIPSINDSWSNNIKVVCNTEFSANAFYNCVNLTNCEGLAYGNVSIISNGIAFDNCANLSNCKGVATAGYPIGGAWGGAYAFYGCDNLVGCNASASGGYGFFLCNNLLNCVGFSECTRNSSPTCTYYSCNNIVNCVGTGSVAVENAGARGFYSCNQLVNCQGTGIASGTGTGYSFYDCSYLNGCKQGEPAPTTAFLGGTNTKIDTLTVVGN